MQDSISTSSSGSSSRQFINPSLFKPYSATPSSEQGQQDETIYISDKPFPLFEFDATKEKWQMNQDAFAKLETVSGSGFVKVISVVGAYRLGKSYLMNQIMNGKKGGFELGHTTESMTKGVWAWGEVVHDPQVGTHILLCLDSEGLLDVDREDETFDMSLFCILTMLSSYMIINLEKRISSDDLNKLAFASDFTNMIVTDQQDDKDYNHEDIQYYTPQLLWLVRDFTLKLKGTEQEYLNEILNEEDKKKKSNVSLIKKNIKKYFGDKMELKTLPCPSSDEDVLTTIEESGDQLSEKFVNGMKSLVNHIRTTASLKKILSPKSNREMYLDTMGFYYYCRKLVEQLNENAKQIQIPNTFESVLTQQLESILNETLENYDKKIQSFIAKFPIEEDSLLDIHSEVSNFYMQKALNRVPHFKREEFHETLLISLGEVSFKDNPEEVQLNSSSKLYNLLERNRDESERYCEQIYIKEINSVKSKMYSVVEQCRSDLEFVRANLLQQLMGPAANKYMTKFFSESQEIMKQTILCQKIDQAEKEKEVLKEEIYNMKEQRKQLVELIQKERTQTNSAMQQLQSQQQALEQQIQLEKQSASSQISNLKNQLENIPKATPTVIYQTVSEPSKSTCSSSRSSRYYSSSDDDDYYSRGSRRSSGGRSGKTFYKGGQFIPGGGRAPKGGVWM
ncbi:guanylate binding protein [Naegleria gruberi]|uniref:Guanylate binding protein n=1 Tax=Naegleria gruberi TaxID=5762 RepID=D2V6T7_NAEGR|nr:guanylate binding protein [Naegleria gruberi]EFC47501.1 guanylate binding protein [Naegleria gruberi]|eukprot:XP_002680245.1 guanylate binding protein [Naegleria gruberi strain NEG-M]